MKNASLPIQSSPTSILNKSCPNPQSVAAERFFESPSSASYGDLVKAAKKAKCEDLVEVAARQFLETGKRPDLNRHNIRRQKPSNTWPLPRAPLDEESDQPLKTGFHREGPHFDVLIQLAIEAKQPDEVLRWYDVRGKSKVAEFRSKHGRKPRLMEVIDRVDKNRITVLGKRR